MMRGLYTRLGLSLAGYFLCIGLSHTHVLEGLPLLFLFVAVYLLSGFDVLWLAVQNILHLEPLGEHFLMALATIGAFAIGAWEEAVAVMLFYQIGEAFQSYAIGKSRRAIASLVEIRPDVASVVRNGEVLRVDPSEVAIGETIQILPGERVPLDATLIEGHTSLDTSALTGESLPQEVVRGDSILSGSINLTSAVMARVEKGFEQSTVNRILELVSEASDHKSQAEQFITRFARVYTPIVVLLALLLAFVPPLILRDSHFSDWIYRALIFLVVSCPCALVVSVPLAFFGGVGAASKRGILVKGANYMEALSRIDTVLCDKTGTLTEGRFRISHIEATHWKKEDVLSWAAAIEAHSHHPLAEAIVSACGNTAFKEKISSVIEHAGGGMEAYVEKDRLLLGNQRFLEAHGVRPLSQRTDSATTVHFAWNDEYIGAIYLEDTIKDDAAQTVQDIKACGVEHLVMLTGDHKNVAERVAKALNIDEVEAELLPQDKLAVVASYVERGSGGVAFLGDGINDAPALARADVGVAMGGLGSDAAIEAADVVIMDDQPHKLVDALSIAKHTVGIAKQNTVFAIGVKVLVLILGAIGFANLWMGVFADVGVTVIAILNAFRAMTYRVA